ncbi:hypothetical protein Efla_000949 [Eimeria flavescens]
MDKKSCVGIPTNSIATQHFGAAATYRRLYHTPVHLAAVLPYTMTKMNPVTMRIEDAATQSTSIVSHLFATAVNSSSLISPAGDLSSLDQYAISTWLLSCCEEYRCMIKLLRQYVAALRAHQLSGLFLKFVFFLDFSAVIVV